MGRANCSKPRAWRLTSCLTSAPRARRWAFCGRRSRRALGLPENVRVVIGSHDQIVNALACGVCEHGDGVDVSGTCECIEPLFAGIPGDFGFTKENFACVPYVDDAGYVTYAYNISGGAVVRWYRDQLAKHLSAQAKAEHVSIYDLLNRACPKEPTDVIVLPFLQGMGGTPDVRPNARGMFYGVTMETGLPEFYRAILEGLTFEMAYNLEKLEGFGVAPNRLYACGGGARSKVWLQIKADIWNREILPVKTEETGALGSAILGFAAVTGEKDRLALAKKFVQLGETDAAGRGARGGLPREVPVLQTAAGFPGGLAAEVDTDAMKAAGRCPDRFCMGRRGDIVGLRRRKWPVYAGDCWRGWLCKRIGFTNRPFQSALQKSDKRREQARHS